MTLKSRLMKALDPRSKRADIYKALGKLLEVLPDVEERLKTFHKDSHFNSRSEVIYFKFLKAKENLESALTRVEGKS